MHISLVNGTSRRALIDLEAEAMRAMVLAFPETKVMAGPVDGYAGIGFGVAFADRRHAVRVGSWAEYPEAIRLLKLWERGN